MLHEPPRRAENVLDQVHSFANVFQVRQSGGTKLDFLFRKTGLLKGKPRDYALVEYGNNDVSSFYTTSLRLPIRAMMLTFFAILVGRSQSFDNGS